MIILITGASHTGKTILAQKLLEKYNYPYLCIEHLKMGLIRSGNTNLTPYDDEQLIAYLWPIVREIIKTVIENKQNIIVEGGYIPFAWRRDFDDKYLGSIKYICIAMTDKYIENHFDDIIYHGKDIEDRYDCVYTIDEVKDGNHVYINGCKQNDKEIMLIDDDYERIIEKIVRDI